MKAASTALLVLFLLLAPAWSAGAQAPAAQAVEHLAFNVTKAPFDNLTLRQAIASAIDRQAVFEAAKGSFPRGWSASSAAGSWFPPFLPQHRAEVRIHPYNLTVARELMEKAGHPGGSGLPELELLYRSDLATERVRVSERGCDTLDCGHCEGDRCGQTAGEDPRGGAARAHRCARSATALLLRRSIATMHAIRDAERR